MWSDPFEGLNESQRQVVAHQEGVCLVCAVAGSGKTRALVNRIARMVRDGADPDKILAVTFTKKAAGEMNGRLAELGCQVKGIGGDEGARVGTFHSVCYEILREEGSPWKDFQVDEDNKLHYVLKDILGYRDMDWQGSDLTEVEGQIGFWKNDLITPEAATHEDSRFVTAYRKFEREREKRGLITFDDMLYLVHQYFARDPDAKARWACRWDHVMVDEWQDSNRAQFEFTRIVSGQCKSLLCVGDDDQCQPAGTRVLTQEGKERIWKDIEDIKKGDRVAVFQRHTGKVVGSREIRDISMRHYVGAVHSISTKNYVTRTTPEHRFLTRWSDRAKKMFVVYMMYRNGFGYRIGSCQLFNSEGTFHLGMRARLEKADAVWILGYHESRHSAILQENRTSVRYGIPMQCFNSPKHSVLSEEDMMSVFQSMDTESALECLRAHGREPKLPLWPFPRTKETGRGSGKHRGTIFKTYSSNLDSQMMKVPTINSGAAWQTIIGNEACPFAGTVFSLEVADQHTYIADGISVCNCIYAWRGSKPEFTVKFSDWWPGATIIRMERNYRSCPEILVPSNKVIAFNKERIEKSNLAVRDAGGSVGRIVAEDMDAEAVHVSDQILALREDGKAWKDVVVLYRTNAQSRAFEEVFIGRRIPHIVVGGTDFYRRKEVADLLAYLRLAVDPNDSEAGARAVNRPFRFIGKETVDKLTSCTQLGFLCACESPPSFIRLQSRQTQSLWKFSQIVRDFARQLSEPGLDGKRRSLTDCLSWLVDKIQYLEWLAKDEGTDTSENSRVSNVRELIRTSNRFATAQEFLAYIDNLAKIKKEQKKEVDAILLMTIHRAKGLEWPVVFLAGCSQGILPHARSEDVEEERRLFYVGMTRAKDVLILSNPRAAMVGSKLVELAPSQFLGEAGIIPPENTVL